MRTRAYTFHMVFRDPRHRVSALGLLAFAALPAAAHAQQPMGTVASRDALVSGTLAVQNDQTSLLSNVLVTAYDHAAPITLARGGEALVCATSQFHMLHAGTGNALLFGLDRGAIQISSPTEPMDMVLTPDIRFTVESPGAFDLRLRVTRDGDTCVENRGDHAPVLLLTSSFADATYRLLPGQHVLFEHGNLREVVDNETSPCGCPPAAPAPAQLAGNATEAEQAAAAHPFPAAASQGLTPAPDVPPPTPTSGGVQTSAELRVTPSETRPTPPPPPRPPGPAKPAPPPQPVSTEPPPAPPGVHDIAHAIGHFFRFLFHPHHK